MTASDRLSSMITSLNDKRLHELFTLFLRPEREAEGNEGDTEQTWLSEIAAIIASTGKDGIQYLIAQIAGADTLHLRAILSASHHMNVSAENTAAEVAKIHDIVRDLLHDDRPEVVADAVEAANALLFKDFVDDVAAMQGHTSPYVVGSVIRYLSRHFPRRAKPLLERSLSSGEPMVVTGAIDALEELGWVEYLPQIRGLLSHPSERVQEVSKMAVTYLESLRRSKRQNMT